MSYPITQAFKSAIERVTGAVSQIDNDHKYIHEGKSYEVSTIQTVSRKFGFEPRVGSSASTASYDSDKYVHFRPTAIGLAGGDITFEVWEGSTKHSTGADMVAQNRNRAKGESEWKFTLGDGSTTPPAAGSYTKIHEFKLWGGTGPGTAVVGAQSGQPLEWVLKRNTKYVFNVTATTDYALNFFWYEEYDG